VEGLNEAYPIIINDFKNPPPPGELEGANGKD